MPLVAGVDCSTQSTSVEVRDAETGAVVASASAPHPTTSPPESEQDPGAWWQAFTTAWAEVGSPAVAAISVAGQQHGLITLDQDDEVIRPAKLWNDTTSAADAEWLIGELEGPGAWVAAMGSVPVASFTISKLSWLQRVEPDNFARMRHILLPHDWMTWKLTGHFVTDRGEASGTGYWSPAEQHYRFDLLGVIDGDIHWEDMVPTVLDPDAVAGHWNGAVVAAGTGDNMAAALGLGLRPGDVAVSLGTSGTVFAVSPRPSMDHDHAVAGFCDATGHWLPLVATLNAAKVTDTMASVLGLDHDAMATQALCSPPGAGGVVMVPFLDGERTPNLPDATGSIWGLTTATTTADMARAAYEGVVCGLLCGLDAMGMDDLAIDSDPGSRGPSSSRLVLTGGAAQSKAYQQILADLAQRSVLVASGAGHAAAGACVQAAVAARLVPSGAGDNRFAAVAEAWGLGHGTQVDPVISAEQAAGVRSQYRAARQRAYGV